MVVVSNFFQPFVGTKMDKLSFIVEAGNPKDAIKSCGATLIDGLMAVSSKPLFLCRGGCYSKRWL